MNPHNSLSHFEFSEINNHTLSGGTRAAPRSKRSVRYVAPRDLPNSTFGATSLHNGTATLDLPNSMFGEITKGEGLFLGASAPFIIGGTALFYAGAGMFSAWSQEFFIGNKRSLGWKTIAKRNGILGAVFGTVAVAGLAVSLAAPKDAQ
tara:strand:+ start:1450 stop:1896 length:447 start_codon:yes stop_codon:yes gene_type:complete